MPAIHWAARIQPDTIKDNYNMQQNGNQNYKQDLSPKDNQIKLGHLIRGGSIYIARGQL